MSDINGVYSLFTKNSGFIISLASGLMNL